LRMLTDVVPKNIASWKLKTKYGTMRLPMPNQVSFFQQQIH
jgi:hypothetical protein